MRQHVADKLIEGLQDGKSVGAVVKELNAYFDNRAKSDPNYHVKVAISGDPKATKKDRVDDAEKKLQH